MLYRMGERPNASPPKPAVLSVPGRYYAHNRKSAVQRAFQGVDILSGRVQPVRFTKKQVADIVGVSLPYLAAAERVANSRPDLRSACESGLQPLLGAVPRRGRAERLANQLAKMDAEERHVFARMVGATLLLDLAVAVEAAAA
jgi:hypothetical protein